MCGVDFNRFAVGDEGLVQVFLTHENIASVELTHREVWVDFVRLIEFLQGQLIVALFGQNHGFGGMNVGAIFDGLASMYRGAAAPSPVRTSPQFPWVSSSRSFWPIFTMASPMAASPWG